MIVFSTALSSLIMLFAIETPDFIELEYLRKNLEYEVASRTNDLKIANDELEKKNRQAKQDMALAAHVQEVLYIHKFNYHAWDIAVQFNPLSGISGDLYDFYTHEGRLRGFGLFDVSGHGIASGLVTVLAKSTLRHEFRNTLNDNLSDAIKQINDSLIKVKGNIENYLTGIICRITPDTVANREQSVLEIANAGAPYPIYKSNSSEKSILITPRKDLPQYGMFGVSGLDISVQTILRPMNIGDIIILYTDGVSESENNNGEQYGRERIQAIIDSLNTKAMSSQEILDAIFDNFKTFVESNKIDDDITILVLKRVQDNSNEDDIEILELLDEVTDA